MSAAPDARQVRSRAFIAAARLYVVGERHKSINPHQTLQATYHLNSQTDGVKHPRRGSHFLTKVGLGRGPKWQPFRRYLW